jgi:hypothetical protein
MEKDIGPFRPNLGTGLLDAQEKFYEISHKIDA